MDAAELLLVGIEVSVAFAGFAGVIATFQFRGAARIDRGDVVGLTMIVSFGLWSAFFSTLPLILSIFEIEPENIWVICSGIGTIYMSYTMYFNYKSMKGVVVSLTARLLFGTAQGIAALLILSMILNASDSVFHKEPGPYLASIFYGLCLVGYMFVRLLLRPLWKAVRAQEAPSPSEA